MNYNQFMQAVEHGNLPHVFLLAGEERFYIEKALEAITRRIFLDGDDMGGVTRLSASATQREIIEAVEAVSFFSPVSLVIVDGATLVGTAKKKKEDADESDSKNEKNAKADKAEALIKEVENMPDSAYLVFVLDSKADKRKKLAKAVAKNGLVLDAEPLRPWDVDQRWLTPKLKTLGKTIAPDARSYFNELISMMEKVSLLYLESEFDKLVMFSSNKCITKSELVEVLSSMPEASLFAINDAISKKNTAKAMFLMKRQLRDGAFFTVLLTVMERNVRQLWQAKLLLASGTKMEELGKHFGLHPFVAKKIGEASKTFTDKQLRRALLDISDADYALKTGSAGDEMLESIVLNLCK